MKKIIALILAAALCLSMAACSKQPSNSGDGASGASQSEFSADNSGQLDPIAIRGTLEDNVYRNTVGDFTIFFSESWTFSSDDELAADSGVSAELLAEGDAEKLFAETESVSELYADREFDGSAIQVFVQQNNVDLDEYIASLAEGIASSWEENGFTISGSETKDFDVNGEKLPGFSVEASFSSDAETIQLHYVNLLREAGGYLYLISIYTFDSVLPENLLSIIYLSADAEQQVDLRRGVVTDGVYRNASMGIAIEPGDGWTFLSDDEMATLYGISTDAFLNEDAAESFESFNIVYDMYCQNDEGSSINVNFEKANLLGGLILGEKDYLELSSSNLESQIDTSSITLLRNELGEIEINGATVPCLYVTIQYNDYGFSIYEAIVAKKTGSYFAAITLAALSESAVEDLAQTVTVE